MLFIEHYGTMEELVKYVSEGSVGDERTRWGSTTQMEQWWMARSAEALTLKTPQ